MLVGSEGAFKTSSIAQAFKGPRFQKVARSSNLSEALACIAPGSLDIVLLSDEFPKGEILGFEEEAHLRGFKGFILHPVAPREPHTQLNLDQASAIKVGDVLVDLSNQRVVVRGVEVQCSSLECRLLAIFCRRPGEPLSHETLLNSVWGNYKGQRHSLRELIRSLRAKIETETPPQYIVTQRRMGYSFVPGPKSSL